MSSRNSSNVYSSSRFIRAEYGCDTLEEAVAEEKRFGVLSNKDRVDDKLECFINDQKDKAIRKRQELDDINQGRECDHILPEDIDLSGFSDDILNFSSQDDFYKFAEIIIKLYKETISIEYVQRNFRRGVKQLLGVELDIPAETIADLKKTVEDPDDVFSMDEYYSSSSGKVSLKLTQILAKAKGKHSKFYRFMRFNIDNLGSLIRYYDLFQKYNPETLFDWKKKGYQILWHQDRGDSSCYQPSLEEMVLVGRLPAKVQARLAGIIDKSDIPKIDWRKFIGKGGMANKALDIYFGLVKSYGRYESVKIINTLLLQDITFCSKLIQKISPLMVKKFYELKYEYHIDPNEKNEYFEGIPLLRFLKYSRHNLGEEILADPDKIKKILLDRDYAEEVFAKIVSDGLPISYRCERYGNLCGLKATQKYVSSGF